jgi:major vault protein
MSKLTEPNVIRIKPLHYIHVLDNNTNVTRVEVGPMTYTRQEHEKIVYGPEPMIMVPTRQYCVISNPVVRDPKTKAVVYDAHHNAKIRFGDEEIRFEQEPFPLYPGESLQGKVSALQVVGPDAALRLRAVRDFDDKVAGDEWLFRGPATFLPRVEVQVVEVIRSIIVKPNTAIKLRARKACVDSEGVARDAGEEWLIRRVGAFLPDVDEEIVETVQAKVLTDKRALHLRANKTFTDVFGIKRKAGEEWLVTINHAETHIPDVNEELVGEVRVTTLSNRQYTVVLDPLDKKGRPQLSMKELRVGPASFFLQPGERLESGIQNIYVLGSEEALLLRSRETFEDTSGLRKPGDLWMIIGPCDYVPPIEVEVVEKRRSIPLDENEGIYVRDLHTGKVRAVIGQSYLLKANEELWEKELPQKVEELLARDRSSGSSRAPSSRSTILPSASGRDKTRLVTYRTPHGAAVQIYDYKDNKARIVFGPELVALMPDEHFTVVTLSGDVPKRPNVIDSLALLLGPDFMTDVVIVETSDHARLSLKLSYNWHFDVNKEDAESASSIFRVPDFVGDACKAIASRVRGAVAGVSFDKFHKNSSDVIRAAVFGIDPETEQVRNRFFFAANNLVITNIDIQSVEPVDQRTRDALQKSVQLAQSAAVEATGQATAEAKARAEAAQIEGEAAVTQSQLKAEAHKIKALAELEQLRNKQLQEVQHRQARVELELNKARELAAIEAKKFKELVDAIGPETIKKMAQAGPEMQAKLLQGLGLKSLMITDGSSPINLFNTAAGLIAPQH